MTIEQIKPEMRVLYSPALEIMAGDYKCIQIGEVSSKNDQYAFVKFDKQVKRIGWNGTTAGACDPGDLAKVSSLDQDQSK